MNPIDRLNQDVWNCIFPYLLPSELGKVACVCRDWRHTLDRFYLDQNPVALLRSRITVARTSFGFHCELGEKLVKEIAKYPAILKEIEEELDYLPLYKEKGQETLTKLVNLCDEHHPQFLAPLAAGINSRENRDIWLIKNLRKTQQRAHYTALFNPSNSQFENLLKLAKKDRFPFKQIHHFSLNEKQKLQLAYTCIDRDPEICREFLHTIDLFRFTSDSLLKVLLYIINNRYDWIAAFSEQLPSIHFPNKEIYLECAQAIFSSYLDDLETAFLELLSLHPFLEDSQVQYQVASMAFKSEQALCCIKYFWKFNGLSTEQNYQLALIFLEYNPSEMEDLVKYLPFFKLDEAQRLNLLLAILKKNPTCFDHSYFRIDPFLPLGEESRRTLKEILGREFTDNPSNSNHESSESKDVALCIQQFSSDLQYDSIERALNRIKTGEAYKEDLESLNCLPIIRLESTNLPQLLLSFIQGSSRHSAIFNSMLQDICRTTLPFLQLSEEYCKDLLLALAPLIPTEVCQKIRCFNSDLYEAYDEIESEVIDILLETQEGQRAFSSNWWLFSVESISTSLSQISIKLPMLLLDMIPFLKSESHDFEMDALLALANESPALLCSLLLHYPFNGDWSKLARALAKKGNLYLVLHHPRFNLKLEEWEKVLYKTPLLTLKQHEKEIRALGNDVSIILNDIFRRSAPVIMPRPTPPPMSSINQLNKILSCKPFK